MYIKAVFEADSPDFLKLSKKEQHPQKRIRLIALEQLKEGKNMSETAKSLGIERHAVGKWHARYKKFGLNGLDNLSKAGRKPKIPKEREEEFIQKIESLQDSKKGGRITGYDIQAIARNEFNADYADDSIYTVLKRLRVSWITSRSKHPKVNKEAQDAFKKTSNKKFSKAFHTE